MTKMRMSRGSKQVAEKLPIRKKRKLEPLPIEDEVEAEVVEPLVEDDTDDDNEEFDIQETVEDKVSTWLTRVNIEDLTPVMYVYKNVGGVRELCGKFVGNEIPDDHSIGILYGSGYYLAAVKIPAGNRAKSRQTSFSFRIAKEYDELRRQQQYAGPLPVHSGGGRITAVPGPDRSFEAFQDGMKFVAEMFRSNLTPATAAPDMSKLMMGQYEHMAEVLKNNLIRTDEFLHKEFRHKKDEAPGNNNEEYDEPENPLMKILPDLLKFLGPLLSNITTNPIVKQAVASPAVQSAVSAAAVNSVQSANSIIQRRKDIQQVKKNGSIKKPVAVQQVKKAGKKDG